MGWLAREYGLACDNVLSFEVVTAAGEGVRASARGTLSCSGDCAGAAATSVW
jgi:FAD/FMN-containing dehydrogenase